MHIFYNELHEIYIFQLGDCNLNLMICMYAQQFHILSTLQSMNGLMEKFGIVKKKSWLEF